MPDLEQEIINELGTQMQSAIDFQILADMLVQIGWHKVELIRLYSRLEEINVWLEENVKNPCERRGTTFVFQDEGDAINFTLRWK